MVKISLIRATTSKRVVISTIVRLSAWAKNVNNLLKKYKKVDSLRISSSAVSFSSPIRSLLDLNQGFLTSFVTFTT